jgi:hypothetical protein
MRSCTHTTVASTYDITHAFSMHNSRRRIRIWDVNFRVGGCIGGKTMIGGCGLAGQCLNW